MRQSILEKRNYGEQVPCRHDNFNKHEGTNLAQEFAIDCERDAGADKKNGGGD